MAKVIILFLAIYVVISIRTFHLHLFRLFILDGQFLVATSNGNMMSPIRCYRVLVRKTDEKCSITSQAWPGFFLQGGGAKDKTGILTIYLH